MAESVDALVSNTSGAIRAGSTPAPGTKAVEKILLLHGLCFAICNCFVGCYRRVPLSIDA